MHDLCDWNSVPWNKIFVFCKSQNKAWWHFFLHQRKRFLYFHCAPLLKRRPPLANLCLWILEALDCWKFHLATKNFLASSGNCKMFSIVFVGICFWWWFGPWFAIDSGLAVNVCKASCRITLKHLPRPTFKGPRHTLNFTWHEIGWKIIAWNGELVWKVWLCTFYLSWI